MFFPPPRHNERHFYPPYPPRPRRVRPFQGYYPEQFPGRPPFLQRDRASIIKSAFIDEQGQFDIGKTIQTVDQVMKTVHQVTPLVKQVSNMILKK